MAYSDQAALAIDVAFRARVQMALVTAARTVLQTARQPGDVGRSYERVLKLAGEILRGPNVLVDMAAWALASVPTISGSSTDSQLQNAVNTLLRNLAEIEE